MGEPAWAIATLFPGQGDWSDEDYLAFSTLPGLCAPVSEVLDAD